MTSRLGISYFIQAIGTIIAMCLWEWGHGRSGEPYVQLGAIAGIAYIAAVALLRWRG